MKGKLQLALPVVLNNESEPIAFLAAKERIEALAGKFNVPVEVGAFLAFMPGFARNPANFEKQVENQKKHRLPIRLVETGVQGNNSLAYIPEDPTYNLNMSSQLESVIIQAARLRNLDPTAPERLVIAPHVGVQTVVGYNGNVPIAKGDFSIPGVYSPEDFEEQEDKIHNRVQENFNKLETIGRKLGLQLAIENAPPIEVKNNHLRPGLNYHLLPFNERDELDSISNGSLVLDVSHLAISNFTPDQIIGNNAVQGERALFEMMNINNWVAYRNLIGKAESYFPSVKALHMSQASGIGFDLPSGPEYDKWGGKGTGEGLLSMQDFHKYFDFARRNNLPISVEEVYDTKNLTYLEADRFLEPIFASYKPK